MIPIENLLAFLVAAFVIIVIPGPSVLFTIGRSIALGRRAGLLSVVGNALGTLPAVAAVSIGIGALVLASPVLLTVVKVAGAAYLVWLGVQAIRHRHDGGRPPARGGRTRARSLLAEGFVVGATNPKTLAFFVAVLPQFVAPDAGAVPLQLAVLGILFGVMAVASDSVWALAAGTAREWFARSPGRLAALSAVGGAVLILLGVILGASGLPI